MSKSVLGGIIAVVVVAAGAYLVWGRLGSAPAAQSTATTTPQTASFKELAAMPPQECAFTSANATQGTVATANGMVRADFTGEASGKPIAGHFIMRDNTSYVWMDGMAQGFKNSLAATTSAPQEEAVSPDERVSYSCHAWAPDESRFALPAGITFLTVGEMQVKAGAAAAGASCGQCAQLPEAAKAQCLAALHC
jgi:hypothetical protein